MRRSFLDLAAFQSDNGGIAAAGYIDCGAPEPSPESPSRGRSTVASKARCVTCDDCYFRKTNLCASARFGTVSDLPADAQGPDGAPAAAPPDRPRAGRRRLTASAAPPPATSRPKSTTATMGAVRPPDGRCAAGRAGRPVADAGAGDRVTRNVERSTAASTAPPETTSSRPPSTDSPSHALHHPGQARQVDAAGDPRDWCRGRARRAGRWASGRACTPRPRRR